MYRLEKAAARERGLRCRRLHRIWSLGSRLWTGICLLVLRSLAPWRFQWASVDLANLRRFYPHHFATELPQLPLPVCMQSLPTIFPPIMIPAVHILLALTDLMLMPWMLLDWFYVAQAHATGASLSLHLLWPMLTVRRRVPSERPAHGARNAALALRNAVLEALPRDFLWKYLTLLHYAILSCNYMVLSLWFSSWIFRATVIAPLEEKAANRKTLLLIPVTLSMLRALSVVNMKAISKLRSYIMRSPLEMSHIRAYHATPWSNIESIRQSGFKVSNAGMLGRGVYISRDLNKVWGYGGPSGAICELRVSVGRIRVIDRQLHPKQTSWREEADTAYVPYRCGMVPSGLEEACVADVKRIQLVRVWDKRVLSILLVYDIFQTGLDQLRWLASYCPTWSWPWLQKLLEVPASRTWSHDVELCMEIPMPPRPQAGKESWEQQPHVTVPPALLKRCEPSRA